MICKPILLMLALLSPILMGLPNHYVSTQQVSVGDTIQYTVERPVSMTNPLTPPELNGFRWISTRRHQRSTANIHVFTYQLFGINNLMVPTLSVSIIPNQPSQILPAISLSLKSVLSPTHNQLNDILPILPIASTHWWWWLLAIIVGIIIGAIALWRYKQQPSHLSQPIARPLPKTVAMHALAELESTLQDHPSVIKASYFRLTEILGEYITHQTGINVVDATTSEIKQLLKHPSFPPNLRSKAVAIFSDMDHYKFSESPQLLLAGLQSTLSAIRTLIGDMDGI